MMDAMAARRDVVPPRTAPSARLRTAGPADVDAIHALIEATRVEGRLLARDRDDIARHIARFVVASAADGTAIACAELAPLSRSLAEVRSLAVRGSARSAGLGRALLGELTARAVRTGFDRLVAFTHVADYFVHQGFSIVPHTWFPEKIAMDCHGCALFRRCGQYAVLLPLSGLRGPTGPLD